MKTIVYISDFRLPNVLNFIEPLKGLEGFKKTLIIETDQLKSDHALHSYFDEIHYVPRLSDSQAIMDTIGQIRANEEIAAVLTPGENAIEIGGEVRSAFGIAGLQRNQAEAVRNKWIMKQMLHQRGIRTSATAIAIHESDYERFADRVGFPLIVKPLSGFGTINTFKLSDRDELKEYVHKTRKQGQRDLLEEYIVGTEFHCDSIVSKGKVVFSSVSQYLYNCLDIARNNMPPASITFPATDPSGFIDRIKTVNELVISALGINQSVTHAELFLTPSGEVVFGEIGARIGGAQVMPPCIKNTHGVDMFKAVVELELGMYEFKPEPAKNLYSGMICFPSREGKIRAISSADDFKHIQGLIDFNVSYQVGQTVSAVNDTMTRSGYAIVEGESFDEVRETLLELYYGFEIQVDAHEHV
ncbi:ATP-grasp domain-containing protein [Paenibacillus sp. DYY-L-2]|uniref:ATP-grasp domain-containing protein n=1 Tax=Paenibacillus sp. DYY-L-2 TaxID=3447013 RepID=UPI003F4FAC4C